MARGETGRVSAKVLEMKRGEGGRHVMEVKSTCSGIAGFWGLSCGW